jgi:hypothetical protein
VQATAPRSGHERDPNSSVGRRLLSTLRGAVAADPLATHPLPRGSRGQRHDKHRDQPGPVKLRQAGAPTLCKRPIDKRLVTAYTWTAPVGVGGSSLGLLSRARRCGSLPSAGPPRLCQPQVYDSRFSSDPATCRQSPTLGWGEEGSRIAVSCCPSLRGCGASGPSCALVCCTPSAREGGSDSKQMHSARLNDPGLDPHLGGRGHKLATPRHDLGGRRAR